MGGIDLKRAASVLLLAAALLPALPAIAQTSDYWPMFRADPEHTGVCSSPVPPAIDLLWEQNISQEELTSPIAAGGRMFAGSLDGNLYALWAASGGEAWHFPIGGRLSAEPVVDGGAVYAVSESGRLCALGIERGELLWEAALPPNLTYSLPLTLAGDSLFFSTPSGVITRVSVAEKGRVLWQVDAGSRMKGPVTVGEGQVFAILEGGKALALEAGSGNQTWSLKPGFGTGDEFTSAYVQARLYFGSKGREVYCLNTVNGSVQWSTVIKSAVSGSPAVGYGMMVLGTENGQVVALNITSGGILWSSDVGANVTISPSMADGMIFLGNERGGIFMLRASSGQMVWLYKAGGSRISSPAISEGRIFFTTRDGGVLAFGQAAPPRPVARLEVSPARVSSGDTVLLSAINSSGTPGFPLSGYYFDFGDGNATWRNGSTANHSYSSKGNYSVSLKVRDSNGTESEAASVQVQVFNYRPEVHLAGPGSAYAGAPVQFEGVGYDSDGSIARFEIDFEGDGITDETSADPRPTFNHTYASSGTYHPVLKAYDDNGSFALETATVAVLPAVPPPAPGPGPSAGPVSLPVAAASVSLVSLAALGAGLSLTEFGKYRLLTLFVVPLYVRLKKDEVLDNYVRGKIHGYIIANPGDHYNSIRDALELSNGIVAHHLHTLEREGLVHSMRDGMYRRFFPANAKLPPEDEGHFNIQKRIVVIIRENPGISQKEIAQKVGVSSPTVNYHVSVLSTARMIRIEKFGRRTRCYVIEQQPQT